jgi:uncharacterized membrane protein YkvA (DUF1232 family)
MLDNKEKKQVGFWDKVLKFIKNPDNDSLELDNNTVEDYSVDSLPTVNQLDDLSNSKYKKNYSEKDFWAKVKKYAKDIGAYPLENAFKLYYSMSMKKASVPQIAAIVAALGYFISPFDLISDVIPGLGFIDDAGVLLLAATSLTCCLEPEVVKAAKDKVSELFGSVGEYFNKLIFGKNMKMVVLGKAQAGNTSFYTFLKDGHPGNPDQTPVEDPIEEFDVKDSENHTMTISSVIDISGQPDYVAKYYKKLVEENDVILFLFDANQFMNNEEYMIDVVDLIAMISIYTSQPLDTKSQKSKAVYIVPTFKDEAVSNGISDNSLKERLLIELGRDNRAKKYAKSSYILSMHQTNDTSSLTNLRDSIFSSYIQNT